MNNSKLNYSFKKQNDIRKWYQFFWWCAGADIQILERCNFSDHVKYGCLGGIVFATGVMAFFSGTVAIHTIFIDTAMQDLWQSWIIPVLAGLAWGLMIFNLDRYIVASSGKGDGTDKVTGQEFKNAIPRIFMGLVLAVSISQPMEVMMFSKEIKMKKEEDIVKNKASKIAEIEKEYQTNIKELNADIEKLYDEKLSYEKNIREREDLLNQEMQGKRGGGSGKGPVANELERQVNELKSRRDRWLEEHKKEIEEMESKRKTYQVKREEELAKAEGQIQDGLIYSLKAAHEIGGWWTKIILFLLFASIEMTPIFFKLMVIKSPYDYLEENIKELILAEQLIHKTHKPLLDLRGNPTDVEEVKYLQAERLLMEQKSKLEAEQNIINYALARWQVDRKEIIDKNPESIITTDNQS